MLYFLFSCRENVGRPFFSCKFMLILCSQRPKHFSSTWLSFVGRFVSLSLFLWIFDIIHYSVLSFLTFAASLHRVKSEGNGVQPALFFCHLLMASFFFFFLSQYSFNEKQSFSTVPGDCWSVSWVNAKREITERSQRSEATKFSGARMPEQRRAGQLVFTRNQPRSR